MPTLKRMQWSVDIGAQPSTIYEVLTTPQGFATWTSAFSEGLYFEGSWEKGERMRFLTPSNHGVVSEIAENAPGECLSIRHIGYIFDGVDDTSSDAIREWAPAYETFRFVPGVQGTTLTVEQDITEAFEGMVEQWPMALQLVKAMSESGRT